MEHQPTTNEKCEKFEWTVRISISLKDGKLYSQIVDVGGYQWRIGADIPGNNYEIMHIYLQLYDFGHLPQDLTVTATLKLSTTKSFVFAKPKERQMQFSTASVNYPQFVRAVDLRNCRYLDDITILAELSVKEPGQINQSDFAGLWNVDKDLVPLLDDARLKHPSLTAYEQCGNHSPTFTKWAFIALGKVLRFLKTKKVKDMNDDACKELRLLWDELNAFGFDDLSWLEPKVQYALCKRNDADRAMELKRLKDDVAALKISLESAEKKLVKAESSFDEENILDDELGY